MSLIIAAFLGALVVGSSICRQNAVNAGSYSGVLLASVGANLSSFYGTHYAAEKQYLLFGAFAFGGFVVGLAMARSKKRAMEASIRTPRAAGVLLISQGNYLGIQKDGGEWALPVSKLLPGEDSAEGAIRTLLEETGRTAILLDIPPFTLYESKGGCVTKIYVGVQDKFLGEPKNSNAAWVSEQQLIAGPFGEYNARLFAHLQHFSFTKGDS